MTLVTEAINPRTVTIDTLPTRAIVELINSEDASVPAAVAAVGDAIARLADVVVERIRNGGRLIYIGAGTSGRLGVLDAAECPPTFGVGPDVVVARIAGGYRALTEALEAVEDDAELGQRDIAELQVGARDVVLGIAASGRTPYVLGAIAAARARGAFTAGLACVHPSPLAGAVELMIAPIVGPEVIAGSTRLKAGTAQKLVLNTLSTTVMVRLGKTFGNLMVDVQPTNEKLRRRAAMIVATATGCPPDEARRLLEAAGYEAKTAIVMALTGVDANEARRRLAAHGGHVRAAVDQEQ
ncbi:N-acetylmuramic acid 6-phosphate etherase [Kallotenue papyrolyticum]|uniref:N-acetylmuramic acid 6-phosphate etherase n=1 Tax=Kallotenue papyrolyticum TaxID=1325125 RepID=UPI00047069CC|nr:N-acetylmuramic acid 6-phosphate etherase [Kallotenue papyrolyticum]